MTGAKTDQMGWEEIVAQARKNLIDHGYPIPQRPIAELDSLVMPEDLDNIKAIPLANLTIRLQGWYAFVTTRVAFSRAELAACTEYFEMKLGQRMHLKSQHLEGRPVKEILRALALEDESIKELNFRRTEIEQRTRTLEGLMQGLEIQCKALGSEQIRRAAAQKIEGGY